MDLRPGYKQTEVGVIPEDWNVCNLDAIAHLERGKFSARPRNDPRYFGGGVPFIQTGDVANSTGVIETYTQTLNEAGMKVSRLFPKGTMFFTIAANIGDLGISKFETACPDSLIAITPKKNIEKKWLFHDLSSKKSVFEELATQNAQLNINLEKLNPFRLAVPPLPEQRAIAETLSDVDELIAGLDRLIAKKRNIKQAAMQQLLTGKTRLPGFDGAWEVKRLGDVLAICHGKSQKGSEANEGKYPILATGGEIGRTNSFLHNRPSVLIGRKGTIDKPQFITTPFWTIDTLFFTDIRELADARFLFYKFLMINWRNYNEASGVPSLSATTIEAIEVRFPRLEEQKAIAAVLSDIDAEITALEAKRDKTRLLKQGMMQELLTGRTRLPVANTAKQPANSHEKPQHNWQFNEAVIIATLTKTFVNDGYPLGRKRYTKFSYLLHRHQQESTEDYQKKAAGPYNPKTRYGGPEKIALDRKYIVESEREKFTGFIPGENAAEAIDYFQKWYERDALIWLEQFRYRKNDELEVLTTIDAAIVELRQQDSPITLAAVKEILNQDNEWRKKLSKSIFADGNIQKAMAESTRLFTTDRGV